MTKHVLLGVTGSIAAYKAADLTRRLLENGCEVRVVMTAAATKFITPLTLRTLSRQPVYSEMFAESVTWRPEHIELAEWADVMVIAPCTANVLAKVAHGLADDLLSCTALAFGAPLLLAPAMNERMWTHAATCENLSQVRSRGVTLVDVGGGDLACGYQGRGRMADVAEIVAAVEDCLGRE